MVQVGAAARYRVLLGLLFLASGVALIVYLVARVSLDLALGLTMGVAVGSGALVWRRLAPPGRREARRRVAAGIVAGLAATCAYDLVRWVAVELGGLAFRPFEAFPLFGRLLIGSGAPAPFAVLAGTCYHLLNGVSFAVAYALTLGDRGWRAGVAWAVVLEALMLTLYPGWLHPASVAEFFGISMLGHLAYGVVLGVTSQRLLARDRAGPPGSDGDGVPHGGC
jgi:hypothetical protein